MFIQKARPATETESTNVSHHCTENHLGPLKAAPGGQHGDTDRLRNHGCLRDEREFLLPTLVHRDTSDDKRHGAREERFPELRAVPSTEGAQQHDREGTCRLGAFLPQPSVQPSEVLRARRAHRARQVGQISTGQAEGNRGLGANTASRLSHRCSTRGRLRWRWLLCGGGLPLWRQHRQRRRWCWRRRRRRLGGSRGGVVVVAVVDLDIEPGRGVQPRLPRD
mmetsp:Transcript_3290/g.10074  ORF Transcript_3290/g.10074 Transcript_3290/m.10074 type:complete len:222 (+) Transcript_3290:852-1517(+)